MSDNIKVAVRMRGLIPREIQSKAAIHWIANHSTSICQNNSNLLPFVFDRVFKSSETNDVIYDEFCAPIVESVINGFNGTIFAYGQTSSGKTFTIMGDDGINMGIAQYTVSDLFDHIQNLPDREFLLRVSYMEIYNEMVIDLLSNSGENLKLQEDQYGNIKVNKLTETIVQEPTQVLELMRKGQRQRKTGDTFMNNKSSRSHSIFRMIIESGIRGKENAAVNVSHFNLVDLAGSEKASLNTPKGTRFKEGVNINKSLFMLSQVISQLSAEKECQFINYRDSKLTRILQNSLGGNALTAIICTVTPASLEETLSTLKFALRAKKIKNKPQINEVETEQALLKKYANKIKKLSEELEATKEEKDQEKKKRRDMQQQIENLKKKFVTYIAPEKSRAARRETWGGCLDMARLKMFPPSKDLLLPHELNMKEDIDNLSMPFSQERIFRIEKRKSEKSLPALLEEESDTNMDFFDGDEATDFEPYKNRISTLSSRSSKCSLERNAFECFKTDVAVQTDEMLPVNLDQSIGRKQSEKISSLMNELTELKEFTRLEKQICCDAHPKIKVSYPSGSEKENSLSENEHRYIETIDTSFDDFNEEHTDLIKNLTNINTKCDRNEFDLEHEIIFDHLTEIINKLNKLLNTKVELSGVSNPYFKIIFQLFHLIFKTQYTLHTNSSENFSKKIDQMFDFLQKILIAINSEKGTDESYTDLISEFVDVTNIVFKEIEEHYKNGNTGKKENLNFVILSSPRNDNLNIPDLINKSFSKSANSSYSQKLSDTKESQTSFYKNCNEAKESQTSFYENCSEAKESQTSFYQNCCEAKESQTSFHENCSETKAQTSFYQNCNEAKESQTSFFKNSNETRESQTSFQENGNEEKKSQTSFQENDNEEKESQTSFLENVNEEKESQTSFSENISNLKTICQCREEINLLEENIQKYLKEISDLHNSCELKEKQFSLSKEKVIIQDQIISSLKNELALKNKEVLNNLEASINQKYRDLKHTSSQTYYINSKFFSPIKDEINEDIIYEESSHEDCMAEISMDLAEQSANNLLGDCLQHEDSDNITKAKNKTCENKLETVKSIAFNMDQTLERNSSDSEMNIILEELFYVRDIALKVMKDNMQLTYFKDVIEKESEIQERSPLELVKMEIQMLKNIINRMDFYLKDRSEASDYLNAVLAKQMEEVSSLQRKCSATEMCLKEKEKLLETMSEALSSLRNRIVKISVHIPVTYSEFIEAEVSATYVSDINYLEKTIDIFEKLIREKESAFTTVKDSKEKHANGTQTDEIYPHITEIYDEKENKNLQEEIISLKEKIKELCLESKDLNQDLQLKTKNLNEIKELYEKKLNDAMLLCETKEKDLEVKVKECVKNIEEKYELEINNQEKEFFAKLKEVGDQYQLQLKEKQDIYLEELAELKTFHAENLSKLEEYYESLMSDLKNKSRENDSFDIRLKLEEEIRERKIREDRLKLSYTQLKNKFKLYMQDVKHKKRQEEKSFKDKEIQTQFKEVSTEKRKSDEVCKQCVLLQQQLTNLQNQIKIKNAVNQLDGPEPNKDLVKELGVKRAKVISLETDNSNMSREIAALKKELLSKSNLLNSCNCRMNPKIIKSTKSETIPDVCQVENANLRLENNKDILQLDIVQKAIQNAKEEVRYAYERGMGPASDMKCLLLQRKLHKKEKEIEELKDLLSKKKSQPLLEKRAAIENRNKAPGCKVPYEQRHPCKAPQGEEENFTPYTKPECPPLIEIDPHQKIRPKNILTPKNKPASIVPQKEEPVKKPIQTVPSSDEEKEKELQRQLRLITGEPDVPECKQQ